MATMNPILRLRRAFRSMGTDAEKADEAVESVVEHSFSRHETELMFQREMALNRQQMAEMRNQIILAVLVIVGLAATVLSIVIAFVD